MTHKLCDSSSPVCLDAVDSDVSTGGTRRLTTPVTLRSISVCNGVKTPQVRLPCFHTRFQRTRPSGTVYFNLPAQKCSAFPEEAYPPGTFYVR